MARMTFLSVLLPVASAALALAAWAASPGGASAHADHLPCATATEACVQAANPPAQDSRPQLTPVPSPTPPGVTPQAPPSGSGLVGPGNEIPWGPIGVGSIFAAIAITAAFFRQRA